MNLVDLFHSFALGSKRLRLLMTPIGLAVFTGILLLLIYAGLFVDRAFGFPALLPGLAGQLVGWPLLSGGLVLWAWCTVWFRRAHGTPVPFNPPRELVTGGPYAWSRNPMLTGVFAFLFGLGVLLQSLSLVFMWTPVFIVLNVIELKLLEEPEMERRFGTSYLDYKRSVPMFVPKV